MLQKYFTLLFHVSLCKQMEPYCKVLPLKQSMEIAGSWCNSVVYGGSFIFTTLNISLLKKYINLSSLLISIILIHFCSID